MISKCGYLTYAPVVETLTQSHSVNNEEHLSHLMFWLGLLSLSPCTIPLTVESVYVEVPFPELLAKEAKEKVILLFFLRLNCCYLQAKMLQYSWFALICNFHF